MYQETNQSKLDIPGENSLYINQIQKGSYNSTVFRNLLIANKYKSFEGKKIKGDLCYDSYYKDFSNNDGLKYTIYCYCYDLKEITENPEIFEFSFEAQIESERGIIGFESVQWDFRTPELAENNLKYFESKSDIIWKEFGEKLFIA